MVELRRGFKVKIRKDLVVGCMYGGVSFVEEIEKYLGKIVEIKSVDYDNDFQILGCGYYFSSEMIESIVEPNQINKTVVKITRILFGLDSINIQNPEELTKLIEILELILNDRIKCTFQKDDFSKYPLSVALSRYSPSLYACGSEGTSTLDSLIKISLKNLLEVKTTYDKFKDLRGEIESLKIKNDRTIVLLDHGSPDFSIGVATCNSNDSYDSVVGFSIAHTKASLNKNYDELKQLVEIFKQ